DFASRRLAEVLSRFAAAPRRRLEVRCDLSVTLRRDLARGDLDLALVKQPSGQLGTLHSWNEQLFWIAADGWRPDPGKPLPLVLFSPGCLYRQYALEALDRARRPWHVAYVSPSLAGVQAALQSGLGVSALG
ncbi:LysR substrate-binding domain-containing protein, partial [Acinetobacter baumannii]